MATEIQMVTAVERDWSTDPVRASDISDWDLTTDVVIGGYGGAGVCAAIEGVEAGADVLAIECRPTGGGTTITSGGQLYIGGGSKLQKDLGYEDSPEEMLKYLLALCGPNADEEKCRYYCERSAAHYDWMVDHGVPFRTAFFPPSEGTIPPGDEGLMYTGSELGYPYRDLAVPAPRGHTVAHPGNNAGLLLMQSLLEAAEGLGVKVAYESYIERVVMDESGRVVGAIATIDGQEKAVRARRGVLLTTGGFIHDRGMVERYAPRILDCFPPLGENTEDGSGIRIGMGAGGAAIRMDESSIVMPFAPPRDLLRGIFFNKLGQRFVAEDLYQCQLGEAVVMHQGGVAYILLDSEIGPENSMGAQVCAEGSLEEIEQALGVPATGLSNTVAQYNQFAANGEDPLFQKHPNWIRPLDKPPYKVLDISTDKCAFPTFTLGGLWTKPTGEVMTVEGRVIPGLYAAGRTSSGFPAAGYNSGMAVADCTFFGRMAGKAAAAADPAD
ncbi:FAD-dependent oxidoreductase [Myxococcota bacterium]|nr:FAD-dependent oxidoreductase [Myxococcota bacterium]